MNHVFVDYENIHHVDLSLFGAKAVMVTILLGAKQSKLGVDLVEKLVEHAASVHLVKLASSGKNSVDFALSYYLGQAVLADPAAYFHIVSKDTGFEPLVDHLRGRGVKLRRHSDFTTLTFSAPPKKTPKLPEDLMTRVVDHLRANPANRPKRKKTLLSHLLALAGKEASEADILGVIEKLDNNGHIVITDGGAVTYHV